MGHTHTVHGTPFPNLKPVGLQPAEDQSPSSLLLPMSHRCPQRCPGEGLGLGTRSSDSEFSSVPY